MKKEYIKPTLCFEQAEPLMMLASSTVLDKLDSSADEMSVSVSENEWESEFSVKSETFPWDE